MYTFWNNLYKFPRFLTAVLLGFFLTTFKPIFKLLTNPNRTMLFLIFNSVIIIIVYLILNKMTGLT